MPRNVFDELRETLESLSSQLSETGARTESERSEFLGSVSVDVSEADGEYVVTADLPGFDRDDVDVTVRDERIHLRARHESEHEESEGERYIRRERARRSVSRTVRLPGPVAEDEASASFNNGVLTIRLPKAGSPSGHSVDIQ